MPLKRDMHFRKLSAIVREALEIDALSVQTQMGMCAFLMATSGARQGVTGSRCVCVFVCVRVLLNLVSANFKCMAVSSDEFKVIRKHDH